MANGVITIRAMAHLQNAIVTGGTLLDKSRAMMKFPDQSAVAIKAKKYPKICFSRDVWVSNLYKFKSLKVTKKRMH